MVLTHIVNPSLFSCGLLGGLMLLLACLAVLKSRQKISPRLGTFLIGVLLLGALLFLSVGEF